MWFYIYERKNAILFPRYEGTIWILVFRWKEIPYPLETLAECYTGTETLDWMRLFGDAVQSNQVCTFRSLVVCLIGHTGMD